MKHSNQVKRCDILVIGHGLAGLRAACAAAGSGDVLVIAKGAPASPEIMGFNTAVCAGDREEDYYNDVMEAGSWISNPVLTRTLVEGASNVVSELESRGILMSRNEDGSYNTMRTLGCNFPRLLHSESDTGPRAMCVFREEAIKSGVKFENAVSALELLVEDNRIYGAIGFNKKNNIMTVYQAKAVILTTGGCGDIFPLTTYPRGISGDGYAMALRCGAELIDMEFLQYEPCCFLSPDSIRGKVAVTTMLVEGGELRNVNEQPFIFDYSIQKSALALKIAKEISEGRGTPHGGVYYDVTALPYQRVAVDHALFYDPALKSGLDLTNEPAEVAPVAHTCIGGLRIDEHCRTKIKGLFAAGEAAGGIHGANRIGGCAGTEVLVFGRIAGESAAAYINTVNDFGYSKDPFSSLRFQMKETEQETNMDTLLNNIRNAIAQSLCITKSESELLNLVKECQGFRKELSDALISSPQVLLKAYEAENILTVGEVMAHASLLRQESRGVFYRVDYPNQNDDMWRKNIVIWMKDSKIESDTSVN